MIQQKRTSLTGLTLSLYRAMGWSVFKTEHRVTIPDKNRRGKTTSFLRDLFGCIDIVAVKTGHNGVLGIQATSLPHVSERIAKSKAVAELEVWLRAGNRFVVIGWVKRGAKWEYKEVELFAGDCEPVVRVRPRKRARPVKQLELFA